MPEASCLLAVDLGLKTGLALFSGDGRLVWYRSSNFGTRTRLRQGLGGIIDGVAGLEHLFLEGGGPLADIWLKEADRRALRVTRVGAESWRQRLLLDRDQRSGALAKRTAGVLARRVISWSGARRPTSLRHDAAEAILLGLYGVLQLGWLEKNPLE